MEMWARRVVGWMNFAPVDSAAASAPGIGARWSQWARRSLPSYSRTALADMLYDQVLGGRGKKGGRRKEKKASLRYTEREGREGGEDKDQGMGWEEGRKGREGNVERRI